MTARTTRNHAGLTCVSESADAFQAVEIPNLDGSLAESQGDGRLLAAAELALARCDFARAKSFCDQLMKSQDRLPCVVRIGCVAAIGLGNVRYFDALRNAVANFRDEHGNEPEARAVADLMEGWIRLSLWRADVPEWICRFDVETLPVAWRRLAACLGVMARLHADQFESAYATASLLMNAGSKLTVKAEGQMMLDVDLKIAKAVACRETGREAEMRQLLEAVIGRWASHGIFMPYLLFMHGTRKSPVLEILADVAPCEVKRVKRMSRAYFANLIRMRNHAFGEKITGALSVREFYLTMLVKRGVSYKELSARFGVSLGRVKNIMLCIYQKLGICSRSELDELVW